MSLALGLALDLAMSLAPDLAMSLAPDLALGLALDLALGLALDLALDLALTMTICLIQKTWRWSISGLIGAMDQRQMIKSSAKSCEHAQKNQPQSVPSGLKMKASGTLKMRAMMREALGSRTAPGTRTTSDIELPD